jgi:hypothetical protein
VPKTVVVLRNDIVPLRDAIRIGVAKRCGPVLVADTSLVGEFGYGRRPLAQCDSWGFVNTIPLYLFKLFLQDNLQRARLHVKTGQLPLL